MVTICFRNSKHVFHFHFLLGDDHQFNSAYYYCFLLSSCVHRFTDSLFVLQVLSAEMMSPL